MSFATRKTGEQSRCNRLSLVLLSIGLVDLRHMRASYEAFLSRDSADAHLFNHFHDDANGLCLAQE
jgi:hypothetical protein